MQRALERAQEIGDEPSAAAIIAYLANLDHRRGNDRAASDHLRDALELIPRTIDARQAATGLEAAAVIAADRGMAQLAVRLFGAAASADPGIAINRYPSEESAYEQAISTVRAVLGEQRFVAAYEAGRGLSVNEAVTEALALVDELAGRAQTVTDAG
jgi:tetratricopeptide (TPR) repeat protein